VTLNLARDPVTAFSHLNYWYEGTLADEQGYKSPLFNFYYEDNRFNWQTRTAEPFRLHWYEGDIEAAQKMLDVAKQGLDRVQSILPVGTPKQIDIYAYATAMEMQATLEQGGPTWVAAGHAEPDTGVIVVTLPTGPEQRLLMEQRIPHELMHILTYQQTGQSYTNLPAWLREGLASIAELYPNPDYLVLLDSAKEKDSLLPIASLCQAFPTDASGALLAYAEAASFTRYLHEQFGNTGLQKLVDGYAEGLDCERGTQVALGSTLIQLDAQWRQQQLGENAWQSALLRLLPWILVMLAVLIAPLLITLASFRRQPALKSQPQ
jgi:hypothetical protein